MATLTEKIDSRETVTGERPSVTMHYILDGTSDDITAKTLLLNSTAATYDGLVRGECTLEPIFVDTTTGAGKWACTVRYVAPEYQPPEVGESSFSFDTGGGTQHITQSLATVGSYAPPGKTAPDFKGAIGVTHDNVEGVDITVPVYNFSETHYIPDADVNKAAYFALTGKVNNAPFKGLAAGEGRPPTTAPHRRRTVAGSSIHSPDLPGERDIQQFWNRTEPLFRLMLEKDIEEAEA